MGYGVIYRAEFKDVNDVLCRVDILKDGYAGAVTSCTLGADPVEIEYQEIDIDSVFMKSNCNFTLVSRTNFQFFGIYTTLMMGYRVDVWRGNEILWRGYIDSEQYGEPFDKLDNYTVSIAASDVGVLDRIKTDRQDGFVSIAGLMSEANVKIGGLCDKIVFSTSLHSGGHPFDLICISRRSFYDADDGYKSYKDAIEDVLLPAGLLAIQHKGEWVFFDRDSIYNEESACRVYNSDGSTSGTRTMINFLGDLEDITSMSGSSILAAPTYNDVRITYNPQVDEKASECEVKTVKDLIYTNMVMVGTTGYEASLRGFEESRYWDGYSTLKVVSREMGGYTKIKPYLSGSDEMWAVLFSLRNANQSRGKFIECMGIPYISTTGGDDRLRIEIEAMMDCRNNYFEPGGAGNETTKDAYRFQCQDTCFVYIPIKLYVKDPLTGSVLCYWDNWNIFNSHSNTFDDEGRWIMGGSVPNNRCFAAWYSESRNKVAAMDGWKTNSLMMGHYDKKELPSRYKRWLNKGDLIPMPPMRGELVLEIWDGTYAYGLDRVESIRYPLYRWVGFKKVTVSVVGYDGVDIDGDNIEYRAWIDKNANEHLGIETKYGSNIDKNQLAIGSYYVKNGSMYDIAVDFVRRSETGVIERHLINTIYSNCAERMNVLDLTMRSDFGFGYRSCERWFAGKKFMPIYRSIDVAMAEENVKLIEFRNNSFLLSEIEAP